MWSISFFKSSRGERLVKEFIEVQPILTQAKITHLLSLLEIYGLAVGPPYVKKIARDLFEIRVTGNLQIRIFFTIRKHTIYLLHGFIKKTQKIPTKELSIALRRLVLV
ncbi:MAG: type II toxin-antitoxin system RelE/ParE family toxin [Candidatus Pacebacteria bacterium CG_4_10_14_0_8_um_filter_43_12]|nr:MAG: type II toxin-antitoxin system RelE/ParE family toxin [Candidatus Pacebacteria bacterium CG10_big_fil_rev_8_21_14_0_10_44_11]PIY79087.1 MAG: type II toxin-antitoxin system RelE/ParE family toxin [Candidatus Pacebacteria bacterium CG_4_10_14_0_8_um_filter_43_12]